MTPLDLLRAPDLTRDRAPVLTRDRAPVLVRLSGYGQAGRVSALRIMRIHAGSSRIQRNIRAGHLPAH